MIKEIIVVEGRDDYIAVKRAVDAEIIVTGGWSLRKSVRESIKTAGERRGVIIFTDPDYAGEMIRKRVQSLVKGCKHAFLPVDLATKNGDIGIENAEPQDILDALNKARAESTEKRQEFTVNDLIENGLLGTLESGLKRDKIGRILGIGHANGKQFLSRLNNYGITREEFIEAIKRVNKQGYENE
ncbi:ribonuclease M5 [Oxobacter pfennigii]|uniref:Ribonuclease M5 n=1 Tax=Oxobacter pfennigii TaxID=36849 RepID=A0A0P8Y8M4_9CLOT|nr:ribonuclease M5 [Oxobacter pfennigii]KPU43087.1 ribonuclease M5 [Oxobacter pfennigii]